MGDGGPHPQRDSDHWQRRKQCRGGAVGIDRHSFQFQKRGRCHGYDRRDWVLLLPRYIWPDAGSKLLGQGNGPENVSEFLTGISEFYVEICGCGTHKLRAELRNTMKSLARRGPVLPRFTCWRWCNTAGIVVNTRHYRKGAPLLRLLRVTE